ncbi:mycofactocin-coupled SDR family oxidoreductase [Amycolatopsis acidicola]|uniref:mycofactocin-coupled SDR family oxidoreductase n=1 Tax=Amycolatopsis acidicola TaxID=2596893 RepID=UPI001FB7B9DB|nr:mycofactocin-coupled SDR family oxidoreductase [Amycolatopsis acidicola]
MSGLEGKVALVTGAARGQGRSHAVRLASEGADILAVDVDGSLPNGARGYPLATADDLAETVRLVRALGRRVVPFSVDIRNHEDLKAAVDAGVGELGGLDIVVANAGVLLIGRADTMGGRDWDEVIDTNLTGVWNTCKAAIPWLVGQNRGGVIVATASIAGVKGVPNISAYAASKHGVVGLVRSLAVELGQHNIRVNAVVPTAVNTPMIQNETLFRLFRPDLEHPTEEDVHAARCASHLLPVPFVEPEDVSNAVAFLVSDQARYITATELKVDAGNTAR